MDLKRKTIGLCCRKNFFDKIQHPILLKQQTRDKKAPSQIFIKGICEQPTTNTILNGKRLNPLTLKSRNKTGMFTLTTSIQHCI